MFIYIYRIVPNFENVKKKKQKKKFTDSNYNILICILVNLY